MTAELLFAVSNLLVLPAWLLLLLLPRWEWTTRLVSHVWIPGLLALAYIYAMQHALPFPEGAGFTSLPEVIAAFSNPWLAVAGWIHYLAFDLFVGAWILRDAQRRGIAHGWCAPCMLMTYLAGPVGLALYFLLRFVMKRTLTTIEM